MNSFKLKPFTATRPIAVRSRRALCCNAQSQHTNGTLKAASGAAALALLCSPTAHAAEIMSSANGLDGSLTFAVGGGVAIAGLGALLVATDPQKRCVLNCVWIIT